MRGASAESQEALVAELGSAIAGGADGDRLADDLFAVAQLLRSEPGLRRILTDQSTAPDAKEGLVHEVFDAKLDEVSVALVGKAVRRRWAGTRDLGFALEHLGVVAVVRAAERAGQADALEGELFEFGRLVSENPPLRDVLSDPARSSADKRALLRELLEGRVTSGTLRLAEQSTSGSHRTVAVAVDEYQRIAARERDRLVALVRVARRLDESASQRLASALSEKYGRPVHLNEVVDSSVIGGIRVEIGDDVIDGTVVSRLEDARRRLAG